MLFLDKIVKKLKLYNDEKLYDDETGGKYILFFFLIIQIKNLFIFSRRLLNKRT
jgi:hypothetical protein